MKLIILSTLFLAFSAQATVHQCAHGNQIYLLALKDNSGIAFERPHGFFQEMDVTVSVIQAMDGGPTNVFLEPNQKVTFARGECWKSQTLLRFKIDSQSTIQLLPSFAFNSKNPRCDRRNLARPLTGPEQAITCKTL